MLSLTKIQRTNVTQNTEKASNLDCIPSLILDTTSGYFLTKEYALEYKNEPSISAQTVLKIIFPPVR